MPNPVVAMVGSSVIGGVSSIASANAQADAAEEATDAQVQANRENIDFQKWLFEQQTALQKPWHDVGSSAIDRLWSDYQSGKFDPNNFEFQKDPGYQFRLQQGIDQLDQSAAARGNLLSGGQQKALARYNQGFASNEYGNAFNRALQGAQLNYNQGAGISGAGQAAAGQMQAAGNVMGQQVGQSTIATGNAIAQGATAQGNAMSSMYGGIAQSANTGIENYLMYKAIG